MLDTMLYVMQANPTSFLDCFPRWRQTESTHGDTPDIPWGNLASLGDKTAQDDPADVCSDDEEERGDAGCNVVFSAEDRSTLGDAEDPEMVNTKPLSIHGMGILLRRHALGPTVTVTDN